MTNIIRSELETRLKAFADSQSPVLKVAFEGRPFTKPDTPYLECFLLNSATVNPAVDGTRSRKVGLFRVNVWVKDGLGTALGDTLAAGIVAAFPLVPKTGLVSIEQTPDAGTTILDASGWRCFPVSISYRYESAV